MANLFIVSDAVWNGSIKLVQDTERVKLTLRRMGFTVDSKVEATIRERITLGQSVPNIVTALTAELLKSV